MAGKMKAEMAKVLTSKKQKTTHQKETNQKVYPTFFLTFSPRPTQLVE